MSCEIKHGEGGVVSIVCTRGSRRPKACKYCGRPSTKLCDHPVTGGTCDVPCCSLHAFPHGLNIDYCLTHHNFVEKQQEANRAETSME